jgi:Leucine Rich repeat
MRSVAALVMIVVAILWCDAVRGQEKIGEVQAMMRVQELGGRALRRGEKLRQRGAGSEHLSNPVVDVNLFECEKLTDDDLGWLKAFPSLTSLSVESTPITDAGLVHLVNLPDLRTLSLSRTRVTDAGLKTVSRLKELRDLMLVDTRITDAGLAEVAKLENLRFLSLGLTSITAAGLRKVSTLPRLTDLALSQTQCNDSWIPELRRFPKLKQLWLNSTAVSDAGLVELAKVQNLTRVFLQDTQITDAGLRHLSGLRNLRMLYVTDTKVTEAGVKELQQQLPQATIVQKEQQLGQRNDPDFDVSVKHPAYTDKHPRVLFDEAHKNFHTASGRYKVFADLITNDGYRVTPNREPLTPALLANYDLFVSANAPGKAGTSESAFTQAECDAVEQWVKNGGSLLLITDHEPFGSGSEELGKRFGVDMSLRVSVDPANETGNGLLFSREKHLLGDHAILRGRSAEETINRVLTFTGQSLKGPPGSSDLLKFSDTAKDVGSDEKEVSVAGRAQGIACKSGRGRVVVMGEAGDLSAQIYGADPPGKMGMNVPGCDNRQFALNIVHWLSGLID